MSDFTKQVSLHGRKVYLSPNDTLVARGQVGTGGEDKPRVLLPGSNDTVSLFDDFLGDTGEFDWTSVSGDTGTATDDAVGVVTGTNGVARVATSASAVLAPSAVVGMGHHLMKQWKANQGNLRYAARVKIGTLAGTHAFFGFSDSGGAEMPAYDTGAGVITHAADCVGFLYSASGQNTSWTAVSARSVGGDSGDQTDALDTTPTENVYDAIELWLDNDSGQQAYFYVNGKLEGKIDQPVNPTVAMVPVVMAFTQTGASKNIDVDYINVSANRDTGL